ncbi:MAG: DUF4173 domain-containing protein [Actinomycetota bacterium]|nr:DUF4173 domain-containing protein [Actinomycetota bacterium]
MENIPELDKKKYWLLLWGLLIGVAFDIFFYGKTLGVSYPLFILLVLSVTALVFCRTYDLLNNWAWLWAVPILALSATFALYSNQVLKVLNFLIIPYLLIMMISVISGTNRSDWSDLRFLADMAIRVFMPIRYINMPFITLFNMQGHSQENKRKIFPRVAIGVLISIPILALVIWLLSSADIIFKGIFANIHFSRIIKHFLLILAITVYAICFYWALLKDFDGKDRSKYGKINWKKFIDPVILMTVLGLLNIVLGVFSAIQFKYLFGGQQYIQPSGFTYAEYARRGFFELVAVAVINFLIILIAVSFLKKESKKSSIAGKVLLSLLVVFTFVMLSSAFYRMFLYEQAYGFTYLRIFVQAFMVLLFFLFIINLVFIWHEPIALIKAYFITTLVVYIALNFANVDAIIAQNNITRYQATGQIDTEYLRGLSYDAVPYLEGLLDDEQAGTEIQDYFNQKHEDLKAQDVWQSLNYSRFRASNIIGRHVK